MDENFFKRDGEIEDECCHCYRKHTPKEKHKTGKVDAKCLRCGKKYKAQFKFGLCTACKQTDAYKENSTEYTMIE